MDTFVPSQLIENRIGEFKTELPSAEEIDAFYSLAKIEEPSDRPYAWSNTISSLDGVVSVGQGYSGVKLVGLKNLPNSKSRTDFRLLASGWAYADAIIFSAASFRAEPEQLLLIPIKELIRFRTETLKKKSEQPDIVMVTATGWLDVQHPAWTTKRRKLVATSKSGLVTLMSKLKHQLHQENASEDIVATWLKERDITIEAFECEGAPGDVNFETMCKYLKAEWNIHSIDVSAGPTLISLMMKAKVIDECRYTTSGIVTGRNPTGGEGIEEPDARPETYPASINDYPIHKAPILEFVGVRMFGPFHVYHRGRWIYRH